MALAKIIQEHQEEVTRAKKEFGPGPWMAEPDRVEFKHAGLDCLLSRNRFGVWCGYVAVTKQHPAFGARYDDVKVDVHGGLTYSDECSGHICHATEDDDKAYWFGFDCGHCYDLSPGMEVIDKQIQKRIGKRFAAPEKIYRDLTYATEETQKLAEQLVRMGRPARKRLLKKK